MGDLGSGDIRGGNLEKGEEERWRVWPSCLTSFELEPAGVHKQTRTDGDNNTTAPRVSGLSLLYSLRRALPETSNVLLPP